MVVLVSMATAYVTRWTLLDKVLECALNITFYFTSERKTILYLVMLCFAVSLSCFFVHSCMSEMSKLTIAPIRLILFCSEYSK